jgi:hypothetical protein
LRQTVFLMIVVSGLASTVTASMLGGSRSFAAEPTTSAAKDGDLIQENAFKDPKSGIELHLPKGWVRKKGIDDTGFEAPAKDRIKAGGLAPNIVLKKDAAPGIKPSDVDAIIDGKRKQYAKLFSGYKDEASDSSLPNIPGKGVGRIDFSFMVSDVLPMRASQIWIVDKDQVYTITCMSLAETYVGNAKIFGAVVKTVAVP